MRLRTLGIPALLVSLSLTGCGMSSAPQVESGSGPAASSTAAASDDTSGTTAKFGQKFKYADGLEVEVTKVETGKLGAYALVGDKEAKKGAPFTKLSVRVRNGSGETVDSIGSTQMHYGPDGDEADAVYDGSKVPQEITGKIVKGKSKTGVYGYVVPKKYRDDVQFEVTVDFVHEAVVFSGKL